MGAKYGKEPKKPRARKVIGTVEAGGLSAVILKEPKKEKKTTKIAIQEQLPHTDHDRHADLDEIGELAATLTTQAREVREAMVAARAEGLELMKKYGLTEYRLIKLSPPRTMRIVHVDDKLAIKTDKAGAAASDEDLDDEKGAGGVDLTED